MKTTELKAPAEIQNPEDFKNLIDLLSVFSEATNRLADLEASINAQVLEIIDEHKPEYAKLQESLTQAESALELLARRHPDWFTVKKSIKTPYGTVSLKANPPKLEVDNEELSIVLIEAEQQRNEEFDAALYLRTHTTLNLEGLAELPNDVLKKFRIKRVQSDTFKVAAATLDLGKAVKEAAAKTN